MSIQGRLLEVTIIGCRNLKDTEWISRQDPYVIIEYANNKFRTRTDTDGGRHPSFREKFVFTLIDGLREINVQVWNSNVLSADSFIGSGKIFLEKVLSTGFDDSSWPISSHRGKSSGEINVIMHYTKPVDKQSAAPCNAPSCNASFHAPSFTAPPYQAPPFTALAAYPPAGQTGYPPIAQPYPPGYSLYGGPSTAGPGGYPPYGTQPPRAYPPNSGAPPGYPPYQGGGGYH